ncbi:hypothetical protein PENTCL1PPCAC_22217, partial [Pristionchus entomophagus]
GAIAVCPADFKLVRDEECYKQITDALNIYSLNGPTTAVEECEPYNAEPLIIKTKEVSSVVAAMIIGSGRMGLTSTSDPIIMISDLLNASEPQN